MKVLTNPHQCTITEIGTNNISLGEFPTGNKLKYIGEWFTFQDKFFTNVCILIFTNKNGKQLLFKGLPKYLEI